jgi:plasmid maintenance system antidote protein VapI
MQMSEIDREEELIAQAKAVVRRFQHDVGECMKDQCMSKAELARRMGISGGRITQILEKQENLTLALCVRIVDAVDASMEVLVLPKNAE